MEDMTFNCAPERNQINTIENYDVEYWATKFGITAQELKAAVKIVGNSPAVVEQHLIK